MSVSARVVGGLLCDSKHFCFLAPFLLLGLVHAATEQHDVESASACHMFPALPLVISAVNPYLDDITYDHQLLQLLI